MREHIWNGYRFVEVECLRYRMRFKIGDDHPDVWKYLFQKFWRTSQAKYLTHGPLHVRELPYEVWEVEMCIDIPKGMKRFEIQHWGLKEI